MMPNENNNNNSNTNEHSEDLKNGQSSPNSNNKDKITIEFGNQNPNLLNNKIFGNNIIKTTKYNFLTLIPKNLFYQLCRASNIYFLIVSILSCLSFSPKDPVSMIGTFVLVLVFTMIKDAIIDYGRYKQDKKSNFRLTTIFKKNNWCEEPCYKICPGDIIKIKADEESACDLLIIKSSNKTGYVYIDTKNLDGESSLKEKYIIEKLKEVPMTDICLNKLIGKISTTKPNANLYQWEGLIDYGQYKNIYCDINNLLLKGTTLKNTNYIYGIAIYTGHNTKIMKNTYNPIPKTSKLIKTMDKLMYSLFAFTFFLCIIFAILNNKFTGKNYYNYDYIFNTKKPITKSSSRFFKNFLIFFIDYYQIIPISLYVVMEIIKIYQGILIYYDFDIYDLSINKPANCREIGLIEELGQVEFIFSDKTGTLTMNEMEFKKCFIHGKIYGAEKEQNECIDTYHSINGDMTAYEVLTGKIIGNGIYSTEDQKKIDMFFLLLCTCHEVFPEFNNGKLNYKGASPDDIALVKGAQQLGYEFQSKNFNTLLIKNTINDDIISCDLKILLPFDSDRKRMTTVIKNNNNLKCYVFTKGSDGIMLKGTHDHFPIIEKYNYIQEKYYAEKIIERFSKEGLRILAMGYKEISDVQINYWDAKIKEAKLNGNHNKLSEIYDEIEGGLIFLGCSAIQDKLQDGVPETIKTLMDCGIRIWMLTGDKLETAEQIGRQCNLIDDDTFLITISDNVNDENNIYNFLFHLCSKYGLLDFINIKNIILEKIVNKFNKNKKNNNLENINSITIIIDGNTLFDILEDEDTSKLFFLLGSISKSVICCRVSPKQKSLIVGLVNTYGKYVTLSIGDGTNDVPMIMKASIGIGIQGKEGTQAVRSADYSIGQFRFLEKLLLYYGRNGYTKIAKYISYYFYKNLILVITELMFVFFDGYSGQIFFPDWYGTMFNAIFTSWPCIFIFAYERELSMQICKKFPILYRSGPKNYYFNLKSFWVYIIFGIIHSVLCFLLPAYSLKTVISKNGKTLNNWKIATVSFSMVIHVVSIKLLIISNFWNYISIAFTIFSVIFYYIVLICLCLYPIGKIFQPEVIGVFKEIMTNFQCLTLILLGPFLICLPDILVKQIYYTYFPNPVEYLLKYQNDKGYLNIVENVLVKTNTTGKIIEDKTKKKFTKGFNEIQNKIKLLNQSSKIFKKAIPQRQLTLIKEENETSNDISVNTFKNNTVSRTNILNGKVDDGDVFEQLRKKISSNARNKLSLSSPNEQNEKSKEETLNDLTTNQILKNGFDEELITNPNEIYAGKNKLVKNKMNSTTNNQLNCSEGIINNSQSQNSYPNINKETNEENVLRNKES